MSPRRFEELRERLLRAGVAPRHARRFVRELSEHYEDALQAELAKGAERGAAEHAARLRLGTEDALVQSMLAQPELRSRGARFPALVFGVGPLLLWSVVLLTTFCGLRLLPVPPAPSPSAELLGTAALALCLLYFRILPVLLGVLVLTAAAQRRLRAYWPLAGAALIDLLAGTVSVHALGATGLGVSSSLLPLLVPFSDVLGPRDLPLFAEGLLRAACMLALSALAQRALSWIGMTFGLPRRSSR
jgi:hypothetical protein